MKLIIIINSVIFMSVTKVIVCDQNISPTITPTEPDDNSDEDQYDENFKKSPHCFRFTWLGPTYDNTTVFNGTCAAFIKKNKLKNIPCKNPLVISDDGTLPDLDYLWTHHKKRILCRKAKGESCIKYGYYFNDLLQNITYMCGKVLTIDEGPVTEGCYSQFDSGYETRICVCQSIAGDHKPCNSSHIITIDLILLLLGSLLMYI